MAPTSTLNANKPDKQKDKKDVKARKAERKKWREINLVKKMEKEKLKKTVKVSENTERSTEQSANDVNNFISSLSIAVPGSILENAQSQELRTYLAGQIARAACIFEVDEIVVFDDYNDEPTARKSTLPDGDGTICARHSVIQLGRILQYLECPQYLRKHFFPLHQDLKYCGILNPLNAPHHMGTTDEFIYREGVVLNKPIKSGHGSIVNVGLLKEVHVDKLITPGLRCTVKLLTPQDINAKKLKGVVVSPSAPRADSGVYWGYSVRIASSLSKVFSQSPYKDGYDVILGTSDKGTSVDAFECPSYKHMLIMFGGLHGLEFAIENDALLKVDDPSLLFDYYLNTLPNQGSRTIRTEEAILVSLAALRSKLNPEGRCTRRYNESTFLVNSL